MNVLCLEYIKAPLWNYNYYNIADTLLYVSAAQPF